MKRVHATGGGGLPAAVRRRLRRHPQVTRALQAARALVHFGPWRHAARTIIRVTRPPRAADHSRAGELPPLNVIDIFATIRRESVCRAGVLPHALLERIRAVTDALPPGEYARFHEVDENVYALVHDPEVLGVLRAYFRAEPELLECTVVVHEAENDALKPLNAQRHYHFDYAGWQSLNLFVYLTDVQEDSGAHEVVIGTHGAKRPRDVLRPWLPDAEVVQRFGARIRSITGPAGTMFFEDTEAFHRRRMMTRRRVMLNVLYSSHRGFLSHGRLARPYAAYLASLRAAGGSAAVPPR